MDISSRLLIFLDVVERGSFASAAQLRNIDRSVISKQMTKLEEELGVRLMNRTTRSFSLTSAGSEMVKKAEELRLLLNDTQRIAQNYHTEPKGLLKIASSTVVGRRYVQPVINDFQKRFPHVEVELRLEDRLVDLVGEGFDLAFRVGEPKDSSLIARRIARNRLLILASPTFLKTHGTPNSLEELSELPAATYASDALRFTSITYQDEQGIEQQMPVKSIFRTNDGDTLMESVLSGTCYIVAPAFLVGKEITEGKLQPILTNTKLVDFAAMYALYPHRDLPVRTRLFLDALRAYIGEETPIWETEIPGFEQMYGFIPPKPMLTF
ncbi:LysR family transcriptional regulator [Pseudoalteromonas sp. BMB]|uniref:LysR substrate-binding domain-containing protein n=1 Tax=Pseudoalteromonas sp. BMB TaxID=1874619 RepID=UPI00083E123D|nr:LysR substrate-binding domain-containing protein [Pseudoalteromonas sp. BMB]ODB34178.1 LysR family transcriptional regulator [Pseudoalteromonas sp. BMB]